jgi:DNA-binding XRE family transcriptional regulator
MAAHASPGRNSKGKRSSGDSSGGKHRETVNSPALAARVREYRIRRGWTLEKFGDRIGLSPATISRVESGCPISVTTRGILVREVGEPSGAPGEGALPVRTDSNSAAAAPPAGALLGTAGGGNG